MNEEIEILKDKLKKKLENYELDKKIGQLSVDSIYSLFPNESKTLLDYIEQLQNNWNELKKYVQEELKEAEDKQTNDISDSVENEGSENEIKTKDVSTGITDASEISTTESFTYSHVDVRL